MPLSTEEEGFLERGPSKEFQSYLRRWHGPAVSGEPRGSQAG